MNKYMSDRESVQEYEIDELFYEKEILKAEKYSLLQNLTYIERQILAHKHPLWVIEYDLYIKDIKYSDYLLPYRDGHIFVYSVLNENEISNLKYYYYLGGIILRVNLSGEKNKHIEDIYTNEVIRENIALAYVNGMQYSGEFIKRNLQNNIQWIFTGLRWEVTKNNLKLNFGQHLSEADYFCNLINKSFYKK